MISKLDRFELFMGSRLLIIICAPVSDIVLFQESRTQKEKNRSTFVLNLSSCNLGHNLVICLTITFFSKPVRFKSSFVSYLSCYFVGGFIYN